MKKLILQLVLLKIQGNKMRKSGRNSGGKRQVDISISNLNSKFIISLYFYPIPTNITDAPATHVIVNTAPTLSLTILDFVNTIPSSLP